MRKLKPVFVVVTIVLLMVAATAVQYIAYMLLFRSLGLDT